MKESEKRDKYLGLARELKKTMEHERDDYTNYKWYANYRLKKIGTGTGGLGNKVTSGNQINCSVVEISQNTEKSPGDLRRFAITQTPVKSIG